MGRPERRKEGDPRLHYNDAELERKEAGKR